MKNGMQSFHGFPELKVKFESFSIIFKLFSFDIIVLPNEEALPPVRYHSTDALPPMFIQG